MGKLKYLETDILELIFEENKVEFPNLRDHLPYLHVKNREFTGIGVYTNFIYLQKIPIVNYKALLSASPSLLIDNLQYPVTYCLDVTNGKITFLELVTNGDELWDGTFRKYLFRNYTM